MISGPALLILGLLLASAGLYLLRRIEPVAALLATGLSLTLALAAWRLPLT